MRLAVRIALNLCQTRDPQPKLNPSHFFSSLCGHQSWRLVHVRCPTSLTLLSSPAAACLRSRCAKMPTNTYFSTTWNAKRSIVADGMFYAELNALFAKELAEQGYASCQVRQSGTRTEIIIHATNVNDVLGDDKHRISELTRVVERR